MDLKPLIDPQEIAQKIKDVARQIDADYKEKDLVILAVLKGSICLVADLMRALTTPFCLETVQCSSYRGRKRGELQIFGLERLKIKGRDLLIVDDMYDSGQTMQRLTAALKELHPRSIRSLVLLEKKSSNGDRPHYALFQVESCFVIGYGLDEDERYRGLPGIYRTASP